MSINLPEAIAGYITSANAHDATLCGQYFTEDAIVHDEGKERKGVAAICAWKEDVNRKYRPVIEPLAVAEGGGRLALKAKVSGDFAGSPIELNFAFTLRGGKIARLEISP